MGVPSGNAATGTGAATTGTSAVTPADAGTIAAIVDVDVVAVVGVVVVVVVVVDVPPPARAPKQPTARIPTPTSHRDAIIPDGPTIHVP